MNFRYVFAQNFYKQHLLQVKFTGIFEEKIGAFIWYPKLHFDGWIHKWSDHTPLMVKRYFKSVSHTRIGFSHPFIIHAYLALFYKKWIMFVSFSSYRLLCSMVVFSAIYIETSVSCDNSMKLGWNGMVEGFNRTFKTLIEWTVYYTVFTFCRKGAVNRSAMHS